jgi:hypothetical protein
VLLGSRFSDGKHPAKNNLALSYLDSSSFIENTAIEEGSVGLFIESAGNSFSGSVFKDNRVEGRKGKSLYIINSQIDFQSSSFLYNFAEYKFKNLYVVLSKLKFVNCTFTDMKDLYTSQQIKSINGGFLYVVESDVEVVGSMFNNGTANNGGAIFASLKSNLTLTDNEFTNSTAMELGGSVYSTSSQELDITLSKFKNNKASIASSIYIDASLG